MGKAISIVVGVLILACIADKNIPVYNENDKSNVADPSNKGFKFYFEQYFQDSIKIVYDDKVVFNMYVQTIKRYAVSKEYCSIDTIRKGAIVYLTLAGKKYQFKPKEDYKYYYFSQGENKLGIVYSNLSRDYY